MLNFDEATIKNMKIKTFKKFIKKKIKLAAFEYLESDKITKSKVMYIKYKKLSVQKYIKSHKFTDEEVYM